MKKALLSVLSLAVVSQLTACVVNDDATVRLSWSVSVNGAPGSCASVGATHIRVIATDASNRASRVDFACTTSGSGEFDLTEGSYSIETQIIDRNGLRLNSVPLVANFTLLAGDLVNLGNFPFAFNLQFDASFRVHMGSAAVTGGNCTSTNAPVPGAGVALEEVRISSGSQCLQFPMTGLQDVSGGQTCTPVLCQLNGVQHFVEGLAPGNYLIQVIGYKGATGPTPTPCYYSLATAFSVGSTDVNLGEIFAPFDPLPADEQKCNATKPEGA